jgi:hypothetical protein
LDLNLIKENYIHQIHRLLSGLKEIVTFIQIINMKALTLPGGNSNIFAQWSPSELLDEFERFIGDKNKINKDEYKGLHELVDREIGYWLWQTDNKRDYNLNLLV